MVKLNFYYKTDAKLHVAVDKETKEGAEAYVKLSIDAKNEQTTEEYCKLQEGFRAVIANELNVDKNLIYPIKEDEFLENYKEE